MDTRKEIDAILATPGGVLSEAQRRRLCELMPIAQRETAQALRAVGIAACPFAVGALVERVQKRYASDTQRLVGRVTRITPTKVIVDWPNGQHTALAFTAVRGFEEGN